MICTCSVHCPESGYHEIACCDRDCDCWCHGPFKVTFTALSGRERFRRFELEAEALKFADQNLGLVSRS